MYQAIQTRYIGPTNLRGARVSAKAEAGRIIVHWDHSLNPEGNHKTAALTLAKKLGWNGKWHGGALPGKGYAFVLETSDIRDNFEIPLAALSAKDLQTIIEQGK